MDLWISAIKPRFKRPRLKIAIQILHTKYGTSRVDALIRLVSQFKIGDSEFDIGYSKKVRNNPKYIDVTNCHNAICLFISNIYVG